MNAQNVKFFNQLWISHMPRTEKDIYSLLAALSEDSIGVFQDTSQVSGSFELFELLSEDEKNVQIKMLQSDKKANFSTVVEKSDKSGFDFMVRINGDVPRGPKVYYTLKEWDLESIPNLQKIAEKLNKRNVNDSRRITETTRGL